MMNSQRPSLKEDMSFNGGKASMRTPMSPGVIEVHELKARKEEIKNKMAKAQEALKSLNDSSSMYEQALQALLSDVLL